MPCRRRWARFCGSRLVSHERHNSYVARGVLATQRVRSTRLVLETPSHSALVRAISAQEPSAYGRAVSVLRRRAVSREPKVPEALVGACLNVAQRRPKLELLVCVFHSLNNAWCTAARLGNAPVACPFGCGHAGGSCMTHLIRGPV